MLAIVLAVTGANAQYSGGEGRGDIAANKAATKLGNNFVTNGNWSTTGNWSSGALPATTETVHISANASLDADVTVQSIDIYTGGVLTILSGKALTVNGELTNYVGNAGLVIKSTVDGTGSLMHSTINVPGMVERYIAKWTDANHGWHFLSSPVANQAISTSFVDITANPMSTNVDLYKWSETENLWINIKNDAGTYNKGTGTTNWSNDVNPVFETGKGYMTACASIQTKEFIGNLNVADVSLTGLTNTTGKTNKGWHLVGNPFSSAIKWNQGSWLKTNIGSVPQIWNEINASYTVLTEDGIIPAQNGFMVYTTGSGALTIPANARLHSGAAWYKSESSNERILLVASDPDGKTAQETIISANSEATEGFDMDYDSYFMTGFAPAFYSINGNDNYALNTLPELSGDRVIPLGFAKNGSTSFNIRLVETIPGITPYLRDLKLNQDQDLSKFPVYSFTSGDGDNANRFQLHFAGVGIDENSSSQVRVYGFDKTICIVSKTGDMLKGEAIVYNMMGQALIRQPLDNTPVTKILMNGFSGYYLVKVTTANHLFSGKVFIK